MDRELKSKSIITSSILVLTISFMYYLDIEVKPGMQQGNEMAPLESAAANAAPALAEVVAIESAPAATIEQASQTEVTKIEANITASVGSEKINAPKRIEPIVTKKELLASVQVIEPSSSGRKIPSRHRELERIQEITASVTPQSRAKLPPRYRLHNTLLHFRAAAGTGVTP